jgi:SagB-type dehydrogenase family enzyme
MVDAREYHERTKHSPRSVRESNVTLNPATRPRPYEIYQDLPRIPLDSIRPPKQPALSAIAESAPDPLAGTDGPAADPPDREMLATLCYEASGVVKTIDHDGRELPYRAASCTGKLYHVDLYLVCGDCEGLDAGVYHFDPRRFAFDVLREGDYRDVLAAASDHSGVADAPVTVVATSTWWRNAWKYRERTYRHAFWDSGTVLANLLAAAHALDYRAEVVLGVADDPVVDLLGLDPEDEAPLELVPVGRDATTNDATDTRSVDAIDPAEEPLSPRQEEYPILHDAWEQSTLDDSDAAREWRDACRTVDLTTDPGDGQRIALDPVDHETASARPLSATIRRRGSCREFDDAPLSRRKLGTVLDRATRGVPGDWTPSGRDGQASERDGLRFNDVYCLLTDVEEVPDGTYQFHPGDTTLERVGDADWRTKTHLALDQEWAGDAHANVYLVTDVDALVEWLGNRGYRAAQLEAGVALGRLYLAAYAHRALGGTGLTFYDDLVTEHLSPRAAGRTPTTLFAFGQRAEA